jgi:hypothetical protein
VISISDMALLILIVAEVNKIVVNLKCDQRPKCSTSKTFPN